MEDRNPYQPPQSAVLVEERVGRAQKVDRILRRLLRVVYATYAFFTGLFCLFALLRLLQQPGAKSFVSILNAGLMAYASVMAFKSMKHGAAGALKYAVLLVVVGFGTTAVYRAIFVADSAPRVDLSNLLIFGIPAALTVWCYRLALPLEPNKPLQPIAREDARSG